jgi:hypothetical protein
MVKIYALMSGELVLYVGKTMVSLKERERRHRTKSNDTCSRYIPKDCEWEMVHVDDVPDDEGVKWEQYYYDTLDPLYNRNRPGQTSSESTKAWRQANRERYNENQRKYRASN